MPLAGPAPIAAAERAGVSYSNASASISTR
jgi:hypothetical protein